MVILTKNHKFYNDDFTMLYYNESFFASFLQTDAWWRPLKGIFYQFFNQNYFLQAHPIIITKIIIHTFLTFYIFSFFGKKQKDYLLLILISLLFYVSQTGYSAIVAIDTAGQLSVTFFGILSFIYLTSYIENKNKINIYVSLFFLTLAFLSKEIAITFVLINGFTLLYFSNLNIVFKKKTRPINIKEFLIINFLMLFILIIYLIIRYKLGATWQPTSFDSNRYDLNLNLINLLSNFSYYFFSLINPLDNYVVHRALLGDKAFKNIVIFFLLLISLAYLSIFSKINFKEDANRYKIILLFISSIPIIFLGKVGELYTYTSVFFFCYLIVGLKLDKISKVALLFLLILNFSSFINKTISVSKISLSINKFEKLFKDNKDIFEKKKIYILKNEGFNKYSYYYLTSFETYMPLFYLHDYYNFSTELVRQFPSKDPNDIFISSFIEKKSSLIMRPTICFNFNFDFKNEKICN